jgi:hypothetical protein
MVAVINFGYKYLKYNLFAWRHGTLIYITITENYHFTSSSPVQM